MTQQLPRSRRNSIHPAWIVAALLGLIVIGIVFIEHPWHNSNPSASQSTSAPVASSSPSASVTPTADTTTVPVNSGNEGSTYLGTVAHHNGEIIISSGEVIVAYGDIHQDGDKWIKEIKTTGPLNENGLPGDVNLQYFYGDNSVDVTQEVQTFEAELIAQGYRMDP